MLRNSLLLAIREIRRNLFRSFLTVLGVVIGVAAVITMVTLGTGATAKVTADIAKLGSNLLIISPGQRRWGGGSGETTDAFSAADAAAIKAHVRNVAASAPTSSRGLPVIFGNQHHFSSVTGTTTEFFKLRDWQVREGRAFSEGDVRGGRAVCVIGETVRKEVFGALSPLGTRVRLQNLSCEVIGVLEPKGQTSMGSDQDDVVLMPLRAFQRRIAGTQDVERIQAAAVEGANMSRVRRDIEDLLRERRGLSATAENDFYVRDMQEVAQALTGTTEVLTMLLGAVAAVSLLVGGIGIMNIMLVSVTERTREIGTRLAIGALEREVLLQFLVEAVVLSSLGGVFGIFLSLGSSYALTRFMEVPYVFNWQITALSFMFSAAVGIVFGFFPARRAARLNPIEALRHE